MSGDGNLPEPPDGPDVKGLAALLETCAEMGMTWEGTATAVLGWLRDQGAATGTDG